MRLRLLSLSLLVACSDPADRYKPPPTSGEGGAPAGSTPPAAGGEGAEGGPQTPGGGGAGGGAGNGCRASDMSSAQIPIAEGEAVALSGTLSTSEQGGPILVELVRLEAEAPVSFYHFECSGPGPFTLSAPPDQGEVWLVAFQDPKGDGPTSDDPSAMAGPVTLGRSAQGDLTLALALGADLGRVALPHQVAGSNAGPKDPPGQGQPMVDPGQPPPEGGAAPGGTPPAGTPPAGSEPAGASPPAAPAPAGG